MNQIVRLFEIDKRIRAKDYPTAASLAVELGVTTRLIYLDRQKLLKMGAPIVWNSQRGGWYYRDASWSLTTAWLSESELLAYFLSVEIALASGNAGLGAALESAVDKLTGSLGEIVSVDVIALRASTSYAHSPAARVEATVFLDLHRAAAGREKVQMHYYTAERGEWGERVVHPYHLRFIRGEWYLIAFDERRRRILNFNIARIEHLKRLNAFFRAAKHVRSARLRASDVQCRSGRRTV